jgi:regulatory protein YycI of two-component signal transduction system YycFG
MVYSYKKISLLLIILSAIIAVAIFLILSRDKDEASEVEENKNEISEVGESNNNISEAESNKNKEEGAKQEQEPKKSYTQQELKERRIKNTNLHQEALDTGSPEECRKIDRDYSRDECYKSLAKQDLNADICEYITDKNIKSGCLYFVYFNRALKEKDAGLCQELPSSSAVEQCSQRVEARNFCDNEECYDEYIQNRQ